MQEGDRFVGFRAVGAAVQDWSMAGAHKFDFRCKKSDSSRNVVRARDKCPFRVSATYSTARRCVVVVSIGVEHNCIGAGQIETGRQTKEKDNLDKGNNKGKRATPPVPQNKGQGQRRYTFTADPPPPS